MVEFQHIFSTLSIINHFLFTQLRLFLQFEVMMMIYQLPCYVKVISADLIAFFCAQRVLLRTHIPSSPNPPYAHLDPHTSQSSTHPSQHWFLTTKYDYPDSPGP